MTILKAYIHVHFMQGKLGHSTLFPESDQYFNLNKIQYQLVSKKKVM